MLSARKVNGELELKTVPFPYECEYPFRCWEIKKGELAIIPLYYQEEKPIVIINLEDYSIQQKIYSFSATNHRASHFFLKDMFIVYEIKEDPESERDIGYAARYMIDV